MADPDRQLESLGNWMMMEPSSPLFEYEPSRYLAGDGWSQDTTGTSTCSPSTGSKYAVGTNALFCEPSPHRILLPLKLIDAVTGVTFLWNASSDCTIFIGIDGQLEPIQASTGSVSLTASPQNHAIRLEASDCAEDSNGAKGTFQFFGIKFNTLDPSEYVWSRSILVYREATDIAGRKTASRLSTTWIQLLSTLASHRRQGDKVKSRIYRMARSSRTQSVIHRPLKRRRR